MPKFFGRSWVGGACGLWILAQSALAPPAQAQIDFDKHCYDAGTAIRCIFTESVFGLDVAALRAYAESVVSGDPRVIEDQTTVVIEAWGGYGGTGYKKKILGIPACSEGYSGSPGYARTALDFDDLANVAPRLNLYVGAGGAHGTGDNSAAKGGAASLVTTKTLYSNPISFQVSTPDSTGALIVAGGGGGGGNCTATFSSSGNGGPGGTAISEIGVAASAKGDDGELHQLVIGDNHRFHFGEGGNPDGLGNPGSRLSPCSGDTDPQTGCNSGEYGVGGLGGARGTFPNDFTGWVGLQPLRYEYGAGGHDPWRMGGSGGGGFGGGGAGTTFHAGRLGGYCWSGAYCNLGEADSGGGGGGGSYARASEVDPSIYPLLGGDSVYNYGNGAIELKIVVDPSLTADLFVLVDTLDDLYMFPGAETRVYITAGNHGPLTALTRVEGNITPESVFDDVSCTWSGEPFGTGTATGYGNGVGLVSDTITLPPGSDVVYELKCFLDKDFVVQQNEKVVFSARVIDRLVDEDPSNNRSSFVLDVAALTDLSAEITQSSSTLVPGERIIYQATFHNAGPHIGAQELATVSFPSGFICEWTSSVSGNALVAGQTTASGLGSISELLQIAPGGSVTFGIDCLGDPSLDGGPRTITASIAPSSIDPDMSNNSASVSTPLVPTSDFSVTVDNGVVDVAAGANVGYDIVVANSGPSTAQHVTVQNSFPDYVPDSCSWTVTKTGGVSRATDGSGTIDQDLDIPHAASVTYHMTCAIPDDAAGILTNRVTLTTDNINTGDTFGQDQDQIILFGDPLADRQVRLDYPGKPAPLALFRGDPFTYTIAFTNAGPDDSSGDSATLDLPDGFSCSWTTTSQGGASGASAAGNGDVTDVLDLPVGAVVTYSVQCMVPDDATGGAIDLTASISGPVADPIPVNNSASDEESEIVLPVELQIATIEILTDPLIPGSPVELRLAVSGDAAGRAFGVLVNDHQPDALDCTWTFDAFAGIEPTSGAGVGAIAQPLDFLASPSLGLFELDCVLDPSATGVLTYSAALSNNPFDSNPSDDHAQISAPIADPVVDVFVTLDDHVSAAITGEELTYTLGVTNGGPSTATDTVVTAAPPLGLECSFISTAAGGASGNGHGSGVLFNTLTLPPHSTVTYTVTCQVTAFATDPIVFSASATPSNPNVTDTDLSNNTASDSDTLTVLSADLSITKTDVAATVVAGTDITYTLVAANAGPDDAVGVQIVDTPPDGLDCSWTSTATGGASGNSAGAGDLADTLAMPAGSTVTYTMDCDVDGLLDPQTTPRITNVATITAPEGDLDTTNNRAVDVNSVLGAYADLSVTKTDGVARVQAGENLAYVVVAANDGPSFDSNVLVSDSPPDALSCTWTSVPAGGASGNTNGSGDLADTLSMPAGSSVTYTFDCVVAANAADLVTNGFIENTVTITGSVDDLDPSDNTATDDDTFVAPVAELSITKTDGSTAELAGGSLTYTIVASNAGPSADPSVQVVDNPPDALTCTWTSVAAGGATGNTNGSGDLADTLSMPVGGSVTYTMICAIDGAASGTLSNTATISGSVGDGNLADNTATDDDTVVDPEADLRIVKTGPATVVPGGSLVYTIQAQNVGPDDEFDAAVTDTLPADLTCTWTAAASGGASGATSGSGDLSEVIDLPVGGVMTYTFTCDVDPGATGTLSNTATITGDAVDPLPANDSDTAETDILTADLRVTKTGPATADAGEQVTYIVTVFNDGPDDDPAARVVDLPTAPHMCAWSAVTTGGAQSTLAGFGAIDQLVDLPDGGSIEYTMVCTLDPGAGGVVSNTATVTASIGEENSANDSATHMVTVGSSADVAVTKTDGVDQVEAGDSLTYLLVVTNLGPSDDPSVGVADTPPGDLTCSWTSVADGGASGQTAGSGNLADTLSMPAGSSVTYTMDCDVDALAAGLLQNTVTVTGSFDPAAGNDSAIDSSTAVPEVAEVSITKTDGQDAAAPGDALVYTVVVSNDGPSDDPSVDVTDTLPLDLTCTWTSVADGGATGNGAGSGNLAETLSMPAGSSVTYTLDCIVDPGASGTVTNTATVVGSLADGDASNNTATDTTELLTTDLSVTKSAPATAVPGQSVVYTVLVANAGPDDDPAARVTDVLPAYHSCTWTAVAAGGAVGDLSGAGSLDEVVDLPAFSSITYTFDCALDPSATGTATNTATVTPSISDANAANDSDSVGVALTPRADLRISKSDSVGTVSPTGTVTYAIVVSNDGPSDDPAARVLDPMPAGTTCSWTAHGTGGATGFGPGAGDLDQTVGLPVGANIHYAFTCDLAAGVGGDLVNEAEVIASVQDPNPGNDTASDDDTLITPHADLVLWKNDGLDQAPAGGRITYLLEVQNLGPEDDPAVVVSDQVNDSLTCAWVSELTGGATGSAGSGSGDISETLSMPAGSLATYMLDCTVELSASGVLSNSASVLGSLPDPNRSNNTATDSDTTLGPPVFSPVEIPLGGSSTVVLALLLASLAWIRLHRL